MMKRQWILALTFFAALNSVAFAQILSIDPITEPASVIYDPYLSGDSIGPQFSFTVRLDKRYNTIFPFYVVIDGSPASSRKLTFADNGTVSLNVGFFQDATYLSEILSSANPSSTGIIEGMFGRNTKKLEQHFTVYPSLKMNQYAPAGSYSGDFSLKLYDGSYPSGTLVQTLPFTYRAAVNPFIDVRLGSSSGTYDAGVSDYNINLGDVSHGATAQFGVFIRANTSYSVNMFTSSGGYLSSPSTSDRIQYSLGFSGNRYSLGSSVTIDSETMKGMYSKALIGEVIIPADQNVEAGVYSDMISFSISAN